MTHPEGATPWPRTDVFPVVFGGEHRFSPAGLGENTCSHGGLGNQWGELMFSPYCLPRLGANISSLPPGPLFPRGLRFSAKQARPPVVPAGPAKNKGGTQVNVPGFIVQFTNDFWCCPNQYKEWTQEMQASKLNDPQRPGLRYELYQSNSHDLRPSGCFSCGTLPRSSSPRRVPLRTHQQRGARSDDLRLLQLPSQMQAWPTWTHATLLFGFSAASGAKGWGLAA